ncbi:enoyl-CoA-hydratase DpgB [Actinacidiphila acididurans]|uniref:Enoyl-CoA hydratase/isomerase family protein n=1 Tax=Actinacidiphila acididurans TaxID=2784346 RepID=A0ABS2U0X3_9ACTN|nr:enoyl-CoA-hydratase DpgB [Actinacidiphila acididurans]MBM9509252.1 enoyl-CoA hydratase/isomerase family protein [Actinacidiphila acididurans]
MVLRTAPVTAGGREVARVDLDLSVPLTAETVAAVGDACARATASASPLLILRLTGGAATDVPWPGQVDVYLVNKWEGALRRLERLDAYTVAVLDGRCSQGAFELLLATDHHLATHESTVSLSGRTDGVWPGALLHRLVHQVGLAKARRLALLPADLDAAALMDLDVLDNLVVDAESGIAEVVARAGGVDGTEVAVRRQLLLDAVTVGYEDALGTHLAACDRALRRAKAGV